MYWLPLVIAGLLEVVWATALKQSDGFTRLWPSVFGVGGALISFVLLSIAIRDLPVGTAYAVWVGIGAVGVTIAGIILFQDALTPPRLVFVGLIVLGVAGLKFIEK